MPDIPVLTMCYSEEFYCEPVSLVSRNEILLRLFETGGTCHTVNMKLFLGLDCLPGSTISASTTSKGTKIFLFKRQYTLLVIFMQS